MACALGVLQGCSGADAVAPVSQGKPVGDSPISGTNSVPAIPRLTRMATDTLVSGGLIAITGEHFAHALDSISLTVGGVVLQVRSASATRIEAVAPAGALPCVATATQPVTLTVAGTVLTAAVVVRAANRLALKAGESVNLLNADDVRCTELAAPTTGSARYMVAVVNTSDVASASSAFELRGSGTGAMAGQTSAMKNPSAFGSLVTAAATTAPSSSLINASLLPGLRTESIVAQQAMVAESRHDDLLDAQRQIAARTGSATTQWSSDRVAKHGRLGVSMASGVSSLNVGDVITMKAIYHSCNAGRDISARVVYAGTRAVVLEDVAAPRARTMDADFRQIGDEFERVQYPLLRDNIGDPLAMNGAMNGDGRVTMLFTRFVNDSLPGTAGYVSACNFYPKSTFAASNENEVFYARVATATEAPADWRRAIRSTVIHEGKHLASFAERLASNTPFEESWLEESTARIAEELYSRTFANGGSWKGNTGYTSTVRCEVYQCDDRPLMMWKHFSVLHQYLRGVDTLSPLGASAGSDYTFYASGWSLVRWAADQYATSEGAWLKALVKGGAQTGLANLAQRTGRPASELLADWALANAVDDVAGFTPARKQLSFPSWNVADVMSGLAGTYPGSFSSSPLRAREMSFGSFTLPVQQLRAFSSSYFSLDGAQSGSQLLELRGEGGAVMAPSSLRMAVVRVQ
jgi:hypothetical protein